MTRVRTINLSGVTADDDGIAASQTPAAGGEQELTLTGTQPPQAMIIDIVTAANESARTFTVTGTDRTGSVISEAILGGAGTPDTVQTTKQFATVTSVTVDDDTAGAVEVGWAAVAYSQWFPINTYADNMETQVAITVTGTVDFDLEQTFNQLQRLKNDDGSAKVYGDIEAEVAVFTDADIDGDTASIQKVLTTRPTAIRLKLNSGAGSLAARVLQPRSR